MMTPKYDDDANVWWWRQRPMLTPKSDDDAKVRCWRQSPMLTPKYDDDAKVRCWRQRPMVDGKVRGSSVLHIIICMNHWPIIAVHSSGAELPAAMKVAPATSSLSPSFCLKRKRKKLQFIATPDNLITIFLQMILDNVDGNYYFMKSEYAPN